ncbi:unnamed protein product [Periconia digitata]|uniref:Uncharacterized protein n=1 Tax=Periconia digitata TaxID=1303443 RepID=A0A9W4UI91_9PLEO|nr:unnamed protein product [Periconia digitata]
MPAVTRTKTGNLPAKIEATLSPAPTSSRKKTTANTSKPRDKKVASGRVGKTPKAKSSTTTTTTTTKTTKTNGTGAGPKKTIHKKKSPAKQVTDKVAGKVEKAKGKIEGKPGKKAAGARVS